MASKIGKYKVGGKDKALSAVDGATISGNLDGIGTLATTGNITVASSATAGFKKGAMLIPCIPDAAQQAITGAGACNVTSFYTAITTDSADAMTLAAGTELGQLKKIQAIVVSSGTATLTIADPKSASLDVITLETLGDFCVLIWAGTAWRVLELGNDNDGTSAPGIA